MQNWWVVGLGLLLTYTSVGLFSFFTSRDRHLNQTMVKLHEGYLAVVIIGTIVMIGIGAFIYFVPGGDGWIALFLCCSPLLAMEAVAYFNCRIFYDKESLTYRNFWGKKKTIKYSEITDVDNGLDFLIFSGKTKITITSDMVGRYDFFEYMKPYIDAILEEKERNKRENPQPVPKVRKFKDSVYRPGELIFACVLSTVLTLGCATVLVLAEYVVAAVVVCTIVGILEFLVLYAPMRAHSSKFWLKVAKRLYQENVLRLDKENDTEPKE